MKKRYLKKKYYRPRRKKKSFLRNKFFWISVLFLILFVVGLYIICFHSYFQIKTLSISGNQKVQTEKIKLLVNEKIKRKILFSDSRSIFLANLGEVEKELLNSFPHIGLVFFDKDYPNELLIAVEERKPVAIMETGGKLFFISDKGVIFEEVNEKKSWLVIRKNTDQEIKLGQRVIEEGTMKKIVEINSELKKIELRAELAEIVNGKRVNVKISEGWYVYFSLAKEVSEQVFNLSVLLEEKISPEIRRNLEYIDLRFGDQLYYKEFTL